LLLPVVEVVMGVYLLFGTFIAVRSERYFAVPFVMLLAVGFFGFGALTLWEARMDKG
jgi:hypothetical protein